MSKDIAILRDLAKQYSEISRKEIQEQRRMLWAAHNAFKEVRPPIYIRHAAWLLEAVGDQMQCEDPFNPDWHGVNEDDYYFWCECPNCGMYGIHYQGRSDRLPCSCEKSIDGDRGINTDSPSLVMAYEAARGFIFEYKQSA